MEDTLYDKFMLSGACVPVWLFLSYLLGAAPTGYLLTRWLKGIDIRTVGSGNPGATNVFRSVGKGAGIATLALDLAKGWLPVWLVAYRNEAFVSPEMNVLAALTGFAAVAGHTWSPFLRFRGGKGVATSAGVFLALIPGPTLAALAAFALGLGASKHVSVGSLAAAVTLPLAAFWTTGPTFASFLAAALGLLIIVKHIPNIRRLLRGEENTLKAK